ncbi:hypothetical protein MLD38_023712 [Melastoma candidum]|uniref:Uncharacterized protein n=1 Tax=Melastoma candidum TaxID=119954 RepID=A0ACB9NUZ9_9MYRT|nr:hypothetical protein MLD38_023712 [Melastoma candidum]
MSCMARELCGGGDGGSNDKARASTVISSSSSGFGYSDHLSPTPGSPIQRPQLVAATAAMCSSYDSGSEIFHLASGINLIGFPKNTPHHFPGLSHRDDEEGSVAWTHHDHHHPHNDLMAPPPLMAGGEADDGEDHSLRCAVFPCERNERPSQGLSLSLSSTNPSGIGLQSFELRQADGPSHQNHGPQFDDLRSDSFYGKLIQLQQMSPGQFPLRSSKFLAPAQELLNEFCSLGSNEYDAKRPKGQKVNKGLEDEKRNGSAASSSNQEQSLQGIELVELQRRKAKLLAMLEEVDRRYRHYCNQMKAVVTSFDSVAGVGSRRSTRPSPPRPCRGTSGALGTG